MSSYNRSKKISETERLYTLSSISKNKANSWIPAALYDQETNSYNNVAINLEAITNYVNSYSSYILSYTLSNFSTTETTYVSYINKNDDNDEIISYVSSYTSYLLNEAIEKLSDNLVRLYSNVKPSNTSYITNNSKKISELHGRENITKYPDHSWVAVAQYDSRTNSYHNIAMNLKSILEVTNSYTTDKFAYVDDRLKNQEEVIGKILNSYLSYITYGNNIPPAYIMAYCSSYTSYLIANATEKLSKNIMDIFNVLKNRNAGNSYIRNNSKKISELNPRDTITYHKDHSWFVLAQYDSRVDSYVNIAMNLDTITSYCDSYSAYLVDNSYSILNNNISYLREYAEGDLSYNIISYSFSYTKDYFEWQIL